MKKCLLTRHFNYKKTTREKEKEKLANVKFYAKLIGNALQVSEMYPIEGFDYERYFPLYGNFNV